MARILKIKISELIESPYQGRLIDEEGGHDLETLQNSISKSGLLNPVIVRAVEGGYELIDGHRRAEVYRRLGNDTIECLVKDLDDREAQVMSVVANLQRENLTNIEKALAFRKVLDQGVFTDKRDLSKAIGMDETYVGDLLNAIKMDKRIIDDILENRTTNDVRLLRAIRKVEDADDNQLSDKQLDIYNRFKEEKLSRAEVQDLVKAEKEQPSEPFSVKLSANKLQVQLNKKLPKAQRDMIRNMLEEKMSEIMKMMNIEQ